MLWVFITVAGIGLFWLGYRHPRRRRWLLPRRAMPRAPESAVDRQHRHLASGGRLGESAVAATAARFGELLRNGRAAEVENSLRPGVEFAVQVQALTAVGTPEAGRVLERLLGRTLARDPVEQAWYWADVAAGLRHLRHVPALAAVLRCADAAADSPAGPVLAAEAVAFPNFAAALADPAGVVGRAAVRAVARAARGCREGALEPGCMLRIGLGDLLARVSETAPPTADPWVTSAVLEAERVYRRVGHWSRLLGPDARPPAERQGMRLLASATRRTRWLARAPERLLARFPAATAEERVAILRCLFEFRADVTRIFPHLPDRRAAWWADAVRCLTWSKSAAAGPVLAAQAARWFDSRRARVVVLLAALRGHRCLEAEAVLLRAARSAAAAYRSAAASALGWWEPFDPAAVLSALRVIRTDPNPATRQAAVAALARLGERAALREVCAALRSEEPAVRVDTANRIADEELSWLWPDLQEAAASPDEATALAASEAGERLREHVLGLAR